MGTSVRETAWVDTVGSKEEFYKGLFLKLDWQRRNTPP